MNGPRPVREILADQQAQIDTLRTEIAQVKAWLSVLETQAGWDPDAMEFPPGDP